MLTNALTTVNKRDLYLLFCEELLLYTVIMQYNNVNINIYRYIYAFDIFTVHSCPITDAVPHINM